MNYDNFIEIVRSRRSIRQCKPDPVNDDIIAKVIEAAKWAPNGNNTQPWEIVVIKDKHLIQQMEELVGEGYEPKFTQRFGAPVMLVILGDPRLSDMYPRGFIREEILHASLSAAIENMLLAATALGLGGGDWKTVPPVGAIKVKDFLGIPQFYVLKALIPLGYPKGDVKTPPKREIVVHENRFDMAKMKSEEELAGIFEEYCGVKQLNKVRAL
jgi:nitroreductase